MSTTSFARRALACALLALLTTVPAHAAREANKAKEPAPAAKAPAASAQPIAAFKDLPRWTPPPAYSVDMVMNAGGQAMTTSPGLAGLLSG